MDCNIPECRAQGSRAGILVSVICTFSYLGIDKRPLPSRLQAIWAGNQRESKITHLPARVGNLATGLAHCTRKSSVSSKSVHAVPLKAVRARARCGVWRTVQADNLSHGELLAEYEFEYSTGVPGEFWLFRGVVVVFGAGGAGVEEVLLLMQRAT